MSPQGGSVLQRAWAHKDVISFFFGTFSGISGLVSWLTHIKGGPLGLLAEIGVFGFGAFFGFLAGFILVGILGSVEEVLERESSDIVAIIIIAAVMLAGGIWMLVTYAHGNNPNPNFHLFVVFGIATLLVPLIFIWYRFLSKPTEQKQQPPKP
jgi:drug/metabolite transporter (DMT)-like permease